MNSLNVNLRSLAAGIVLGALLFFLGLSTKSAFAADLPSRLPPIAVPAAPAISPFNGFYGGLNTGWVSQPSGFAAGAQAGYNLMIDHFLVGVEGDLDGVLAQSSIAKPVGASVSATTTSNVSVATAGQLSWLGTARGRIGWSPWTNVLVYGTGGLAAGGLAQQASLYGVSVSKAAPLVISAVESSTRNVRFGWVAGGGVEAIPLPSIAPKVGVKLEALYYNLQGTDLNFWKAGQLPGAQGVNGALVRIGANYHF